MNMEKPEASKQRIRSGSSTGTSSSCFEAVERYKVAVVGAPGAGKTSVVRAWMGLSVPTVYTPTVGVEVHSVSVGPNCQLELHDVRGDVTLMDAARSLEDADAVVLVYAFYRSKETLEVLEKVWIPEVQIRTRANTHHFLMICGIPAVPDVLSNADLLCEDSFRCMLQLPGWRTSVMPFPLDGDVRTTAVMTLRDLIRHIRISQIIASKL